MREDSEFVVVYITAPSESEAERIAGALVEERLAPCVNVVPQVLSTYSWEGKIQTDRELLLIVKTRADLFSRLEARVLELHCYEVPEIICLPIVKGSDKYVKWMKDFFG